LYKLRLLQEVYHERKDPSERSHTLFPVFCCQNCFIINFSGETAIPDIKTIIMALTKSAKQYTRERIRSLLRYGFSFLVDTARGTRVSVVRKGGSVFYKYKNNLYPDYLNRGNAVSFIADKAREYCHGYGVDIGAGQWPFPGAVPIQEAEHENAYKLDNFPDSSLDYVFSSHCLEHLDRWQDALALWIAKLKPGGILFLYLPHESMHLWRPGAPWVGDCHKWVPTYEAISSFLAGKGAEVVEYNPARDRYWSFHIVARKRE
jgi:SAM-dependent methyltransferase